MKDVLAQRVTDAQERARERAAWLLNEVDSLAAELVQRGARRVVLFGSLAGGIPHAGSDIDLCVEGLAARDAELAALDLSERLGVRVDVVRWETAPPALRQVVEKYGRPMAIHRGT